MTSAWVIVAACLLVEAFFSGSEIALISADRLRLESAARRGKLGSRLAVSLLEKPWRMLGTTLLGTNAAVVTASITLTFSLLQTVGPSGELIAAAILAPLVLVLGEVLPKSVFRAGANRIAPAVAVPIYLLSRLLFPVIFLLTRVATLVVRVVPASPDARHAPLDREELKTVLKRRGRSDIKVEESLIISRIIDFRDVTVQEAMRPLSGIDAISADTMVAEAKRIVTDGQYSRYPVFEERIDNIIGILVVFDLLPMRDPSAPVASLCRKPFIVPETMKAERLLAEMQARREHMAVAVDEFGGVAGIITIEDILEEVVGEIEDETDTPEAPVRRIDATNLLISGKAEVEFLNEEYGLNIPESDDYTTIAGFLLYKLGRIPKPGETLKDGNKTYTIAQASDRSVDRVHVKTEG